MTESLGRSIFVSGTILISKEIMTMKNEYTAVIKQEDDCWVGWIEEVPGVNCQEKTYEELKETLRGHAKGGVGI